MANNKQINGAQPNFTGQIDGILADIKEMLLSGELSDGPKVKEFERVVAQATGSVYAVAVNSGGVALELALKAFDVKGKEVIVPTDTFIATANAVTQAGGTPVLADVSRDTLCLDISNLESIISEKTCGIILVHMFGQIIPNLSDLKALCKKHHLFLLEDAAHAHGATHEGVMAGNLGDAACFSYYATKIITTGEGGMVTTNNGNLTEKLLSLRNHGKSSNKPVYSIPSNNFRLTELQAILGIYQMSALCENVQRRNYIAKQYREALGNITNIELLPEYSNVGHSYWRFPLYLSKGIERVGLQKVLWDKYKIRITWMYEPLCHLQPVMIKSQQRKSFPVAEECMRNLICLPTHGGISDEDTQYIANSIVAELN